MCACDDACAGCAGHTKAYHLEETVVQGCHQGLLMASVVIRDTHVRPDSQPMEGCHHARPVSHVAGSAEDAETKQQTDRFVRRQARVHRQARGYDSKALLLVMVLYGSRHQASGKTEAYSQAKCAKVKQSATSGV